MNKELFSLSRYISLIFFLILFMFSCQGQHAGNIENRNSTLARNLISSIQRDTIISDIPPDQNERSQDFIRMRIDELIGNSMREWCMNSGVEYSPPYILFRVFKREKEFEIWGGNSPSDSLVLICTLPVCAMDSHPGPKLKQGDGKTPEGFYSCQILYGSRYNFMWIKMDPDKIDRFGKAGEGSSFKLCIDYPNNLDRNRTQDIVGDSSPGGEICLHGNCVSAGCISFENRFFLPVFFFATNHRLARYGPPQIHIFPFRFTKDLKSQNANSYYLMNDHQLIYFWENLEEGYHLFEENRKALIINFSEGKYLFN